MSQDEEARLVEKLRKIETLFARATEPGERVAAGNAGERILQRLQQLDATLRAHLDSVTKRVIATALHRDDSEVEERPEAEPRGATRQGTLALG